MGSKICRGCGGMFPPPHHNSRYCGEMIGKLCPECHGEFSVRCGPATRECCSTSCARRRMRRENYTISVERICLICQGEFTATSSRQVICPGEHHSPCATCGEAIAIDHRNFTEGRGIHCDGICSTLGQMGSPLKRELIPQYKDVNGWARRFKGTHGRKPTRHDFLEYFGVPLPRNRHDTTLFDLARGSGWEAKVESFLREKYPTLSIKPRHRQRLTSGKIMEIDLYIPTLSLGFEVQDTKTHSKDKDNDPSPFGGYKKGPTYHGEKITGYAELGITVFEIWQDAIESGEYKTLIEKALAWRMERGIPW